LHVEQLSNELPTGSVSDERFLFQTLFKQAYDIETKNKNELAI
jgi:hypothetical protein